MKERSAVRPYFLNHAVPIHAFEHAVHAHLFEQAVQAHVLNGGSQIPASVFCPGHLPLGRLRLAAHEV